MDKTTRKVPELNLSFFSEGSASERQRFVDDLFMGLKDFGFINLEGHSVSDETLALAYGLVREFFALPLEKKAEYVCSAGGGQRGYTPFKREHAKDNPNPDLKEFWHVGRELPPGHYMEKYYPPNVWPHVIPGFQEAMLDLYRSLDRTSYLLLQALEIALDVPTGYFTAMIENGNSILRSIHYPPVSAEDAVCSMRAAPHADINLITLLVGATDPGLELLDRDGSWLPVNARAGQIVVDSGDMLSRITNNVIPSTIHRVVNPPDSRGARYSMPFFVHPHSEVVLSCIPSCIGEGRKFPDITSHAFLQERLKEIGLIY